MGRQDSNLRSRKTTDLHLPQLAALYLPICVICTGVAKAITLKLLNVNIFNERASDRIRTDDRWVYKTVALPTELHWLFPKTLKIPKTVGIVNTKLLNT